MLWLHYQHYDICSYLVALLLKYVSFYWLIPLDIFPDFALIFFQWPCSCWRRCLRILFYNCCAATVEDTDFFQCCCWTKFLLFSLAVLLLEKPLSGSFFCSGCAVAAREGVSVLFFAMALLLRDKMPIFSMSCYCALLQWLYCCWGVPSYYF